MSESAGANSGSGVLKLTAAQCLERLAAATVGRVGYVSPRGLQIIPVSYRLAGSTLMLATTPGSFLAQLGESDGAVAFEVDYHGPNFDVAWSVLMHGTVHLLDEAGRQRLAELRRPLLSWLGESATLHLEFVPQDFSGRVLQHHQTR
jgi:nitroimidazol reductase NimA-like FMN-containing flavoprotein (pyridoxamine 5'-phosphate oxidase superfamily)